MRRLAVLLAALVVLAAGAPALVISAQDDPEAAECDETMPAPDPLPADAAAPPSSTGGLPDPLALMPLEVKIGQMLVAGVQDTELGDDERAVIVDLHVGNVILMGRNFDSPQQVLGLTQDLQRLALESNGVGLLIATDQEGGLVQRANSYAGFTPMPDAATVGLARCPALLRQYGRMSGEELAAVGVNWAMAPVLDVNDNPTNPVIGALNRSFGTTPELVEEAALPFIAGLHDAGVMATGKHFPGHGATTADSHKSLPFVEKSRADLEAVDIAPFRAAVAQGIGAIMPAHVVYPALDPEELPATVSAPIQTGLLREELGFTGLVVTDDMGMAGITELYPPEESGVRAVLAVADVLTCVRMETDGSCSPEMLQPLRDGLLRAVAEGRVPVERIDASVRRILATKARLAVGPAPDSDLRQIRGGEHMRILADVFAMVAVRQEEAGKP
ncbi:MAG: beta-N-acetylhexosaminidase [Chloroflexota bacterium]|nr:beta-N-acetylhexosaminidase [Chloroflexota bacterium]